LETKVSPLRDFSTINPQRSASAEYGRLHDRTFKIRVSYLLEVLKTIGGPGSLGFLVMMVGASMVTIRVWPRTRNICGRAVASVFVLYLGLATPAVANSIVEALPAVPTPLASDVRNIGTLVVFDGDNLAGRQRRARRILQQAAPDTVYLLGAHYLLADLHMAMRPGTALHHDATTWNTSAQVERVLDIAEGAPWPSIAIVASRVQMPRIAALFARANAPLLLVASELDREPDSAGLSRWFPSYDALLASRDAIYEHAALAYYRWQGELT
jgi:hypothetical protein